MVSGTTCSIIYNKSVSWFFERIATNGKTATMQPKHRLGNWQLQGRSYWPLASLLQIRSWPAMGLLQKSKGQSAPMVFITIVTEGSSFSISKFISESYEVQLWCAASLLQIFCNTNKKLSNKLSKRPNHSHGHFPSQMTLSPDSYPAP
jgi:hypothetical protein